MKILSPAGNFESLKMAVFNGANEVYLGINDFNARNNIDGFSLKNIKDAIDFAHIYNVKVLLAINILFDNTELQNALNIIVDSYNMGIDAFIVQDLGLAQLVSHNYPQIELHASTQMGIHNLEGVKAIEPFGFKRVVLARETPLNEIKRIKQNSNIEIEYFAQGALCVSFSGNCYLSSYMFDESGNRGKCKQLCRLPYSFLKNGKHIKSGYLLSAKDFNMINNLKQLKEAGVDVIKIEGRARRPYYVAVTTREYYNAINGIKVNHDNIKLAFNRNFTPGYFNGNGNIISEFQSHIGIPIGKVEKVNKGNKFNEVFITSNRELFPKSTFKFFINNKEKTTLTAFDLKEVSKGKYKLTTTQQVSVGDNVSLIIDSNHESEVLNKSIRKVIKIKITAKANEKINALVSLPDKIISINGDICEKANKQPLTINDLTENFNKSDLFEAKLEINELQDIFMPKQKLNEFRRTVFSKILEELTQKHYHNLEKIKIVNNYTPTKFNNFQIVEHKNETLRSLNIIYSPSFYEIEDIKEIQSKCKNESRNLYLDTPNFALKEDIKVLKDIITQTNVSIIANNYYSLTFDTNIIIGAGLNVYNNITAKVFNKPIITAESNVGTRINFPYMTLRHCPFKSHLKATCAKCPYSTDFTYKLQSGKEMKLKRKKLSTCTFYLTD